MHPFSHSVNHAFRAEGAAWTCCREVREKMTAELGRLTIADGESAFLEGWVSNHADVMARMAKRWG